MWYSTILKGGKRSHEPHFINEEDIRGNFMYIYTHTHIYKAIVSIFLLYLEKDFSIQKYFKYGKCKDSMMGNVKIPC